MFENFIPVLLVLAVAVVFSAVFLGLSFALGPRRSTPLKDATYECGHQVRGTTQIRFFVRFFMVALLFLLFDLEAVFLYPWVLIFNELNAAGHGTFALVEMLVFVFILVVGLIYEWKKGGLEWQ